MDLIFYLSGAHETLPKSEVLSLLKNKRVKYDIIENLDQILVCRIKDINNSIFELLGMTHSVLEYIGLCEPTPSKIRNLASKIGRVSETFSVRVNRIKDHSKNFSSLNLEKSIGDVIEGGSVDLKHPKIAFMGFLTSEKFVLGRSLLEVKRSRFAARKPHMRPYFHPSSLSPLLSSTLCNICGITRGKNVLDPFCGTGGILIEAGLLGANVYGIDIDESMVQGTRENLSHFGIKGNITKGDATNLDMDKKYDIVITDPPYGRASTTMGREVTTLYEKAVKSIYTILKEGGTACIISPETIPLEEIAVNVGFIISEIHHLRVHKSLTRKIVILLK
jgi:tRNA (guanine10-N2)-dimethyltransferase